MVVLEPSSPSRHDLLVISWKWKEVAQVSCRVSQAIFQPWTNMLIRTTILGALHSALLCRPELHVGYHISFHGPPSNTTRYLRDELCTGPSQGHPGDRTSRALDTLAHRREIPS